jgi:16S rRNA A1518/A1519 N6-dimethyltransferase RsmA/KsgA/DIM1 with predicted DNA glycosylase/AP lyase activity
VGPITWGRDIAEVYDTIYSRSSIPRPSIRSLTSWPSGPALELAIGTGRVALPLRARGIPVHGIELSPHMVQQLRAKPGADAVPVTVGNMTTARVPGTFTVVYLVANTIMNVTIQDPLPGGSWTPTS